MRSYVLRLWVHEAEDGLLSEVVIRANTRMEAAAEALHYFICLSRPVTLDAYLECDPNDGEYLRVRHVLEWMRNSANGRAQNPVYRAVLDRFGE